MPARFRLTVWKPLKLQHPCSLPASEPPAEDELEIAGFEGPRTFKSEELCEAIYQWDPGEDDVFGVQDSELAGRFQREIYEGFDPRIAPSKRSPKELALVVSNLSQALAANAAIDSLWSGTAEVSADEEEGEDIVMPAAIPLALLGHLRWIAEAFSDVPGCHIATR